MKTKTIRAGREQNGRKALKSGRQVHSQEAKAERVVAHAKFMLKRLEKFRPLLEPTECAQLSNLDFSWLEKIPTEELTAFLEIVQRRRDVLDTADHMIQYFEKVVRDPFVAASKLVIGRDGKVTRVL
jgi:hypothetical protein